MIRQFRARGINNTISCDFSFHDDINVITGKNGAGKTTVLKIIWYLLSANIERIAKETRFESLFLETDNFAVSIDKVVGEAQKNDLYTFSFKMHGVAEEIKVTLIDIAQEVPQIRAINYNIARLGGSLFFPTFRRVEGGFSMNTFSRRVSVDQRLYGDEGGDLIQRGFNTLSHKLTPVGDHTFVSSISTDDIVLLLTAKYASISEQTNRSHKELSERIFAQINEYQGSRFDNESTQLQKAKETLNEIAGRVGDFTKLTDTLLKPFTTLSTLVAKTFENKAIEISENIILGDRSNRVNSSLLSSGEKQMLSFLSYNAFFDKIPIFIDEPEISLHVDWQRILFPTLLDQGTSNQFIVATHSPFIYTKYKDKELTLDIDRGAG